MIDSGLQLEMNFDGSINRFQTCLDNGVFVMLVEHNSPGKDTDPALAGERLAELEYGILNINELPTGLAITDKYAFLDSWGAAEYASSLSTESRDRHVIYLSGRNSSLDEFADAASFCAASGFSNVVPVTGDSLPGEGFKETRRRNFTESIHGIQHLSQHKYPFFAGCAVNPFKYTAPDLFTQYFKLVKKVNCGAKFVVTQLGWDMMKLQALRWYLSYRGMHYPTIARLMLLTPERVSSIIGNRYPGVHITPAFQSLLEKELKFSYNQFEAAQWRRLELQAAGCRLIGYSGIQVAGLDTADKIRIAARRVASALNEFTSFEHWVHEYQEYMARVEMAPSHNSFYMFDRLLTTAHLDGTPKMKEGTKLPLDKGEKFNYNLKKFMFPHTDRQNPGEHLIMKKLLAGCRDCSSCRLPKTFYICPEQCPKGLANGPCGGTKIDGTCELGAMECIHSKMMRLAVWLNQVDSLEEQIIPPVTRRLR